MYVDDNGDDGGDGEAMGQKPYAIDQEIMHRRMIIPDPCPHSSLHFAKNVPAPLKEDEDKGWCTHCFNSSQSIPHC